MARCALLLLLTRALSLALAVAALHFYWADSSSNDRLHTNALDYSSKLLSLQFTLCLAEGVGQVVSLFLGLGSLPRDFLLRLCLMSLDTILGLLTFGSTSAVLGVTSFLRARGVIDHPTAVRLLWHGRLGLATGVFSMLTAFINLFAAAELEPQPQVPPAGAAAA